MRCRCAPNNRCGRCDEPRLSDMEMFAFSWLSVAFAMTESTGHKRSHRFLRWLDEHTDAA